LQDRPTKLTCDFYGPNIDQYLQKNFNTETTYHKLFAMQNNISKLITIPMFGNCTIFDIKAQSLALLVLHSYAHTRIHVH